MNDGQAEHDRPLTPVVFAYAFGSNSDDSVRRDWQRVYVPAKSGGQSKPKRWPLATSSR